MTESLRSTVTRHVVRAGLPMVVLAGVLVAPSRASAQERLVTQHSIGLGTTVEAVRFGGDGLRQFNFGGLDSARVLRVTQFSSPVTTAWTLSRGWHVDVTALYANATVDYRDPVSGSERSSTLSGVSDVRVRATSPVLRDALVITVGANVPTGHTSLTGNEFGVLRILAAPSLGMGASPVGAGPSGTMGAVYAKQVSAWSLAVGGSYEYRGRYSPVAALVAGAPSADFQPGGVIRASATGDRTVGPHRLSVALEADVFSDDELRTPTSTGSGVARTVVRLGPVFSSDVQMLFAAPRFRQLLGYASLRWRAPFERNGSSVEKSSGQYFDTGVRGAVAMAPQRDFVFAVDTRLHTGLGIDEGLPTSGVASASLTAGVEVRRGQLSLQPYLRGQGGVLRQRGDAQTLSQPFQGVVFGIVAVTRF